MNPNMNIMNLFSSNIDRQRTCGPCINIEVPICPISTSTHFWLFRVHIGIHPLISMNLLWTFLELFWLGKSNGKKWYQIQTLLFGSSLKLQCKKSLFFSDFALQNMVERTLPKRLETSGQRVYCKFWHISRPFGVFTFWRIFSVFKNNWVFLVFLVHPETTLPNGLETSGQRAYS